MSGIFGVVSRSNCMEDLFYGTDYQSHLGTEFGGLAIQGNEVVGAYSVGVCKVEVFVP